MQQALRSTLETLLDRRDLSEEQADALLVALTDEQLSPAMAGAILAALRSKGTTPDEVRGFARAMRRLARRPRIADGTPTVDIVGTGGDSSGSLNISTGTALLVAACGVRVVKHGNRAMSSRCGSADLLAALGLDLPLDEEAAGRCLDETGFTFLFAPYYHTCLKALAPVRTALGVRTVFNIMGPLVNPAEPAYYLIGAYSLPAAELLASTLSGMGIQRAFVVHGDLGWDEPTPASPFTLFDVHPGRIERVSRRAEDYGLDPCRPEELAGGDAAYNAGALRAVLQGRDRGAHRNALLLGASLVMELMGRSTAREGVEIAAQALDSGRAAQTLERLAQFRTVAA